MNWKTWLLPLLTEDMRQALSPLDLSGVTEIRLRLGKPMEVVTAQGSRLLYAPNGRPMLREGEQEGLLSAFCCHARYAWEKEIRQGFITLNSGCRVGVAGRIARETGAPALVTGFCIRILRSVVGCGEALLPALLREGRLLSTLLFSAPGCGKTTLLRDVIRLLSDGRCGALPHRVGVVGSLVSDSLGAAAAGLDLVKGALGRTGMLLAAIQVARPAASLLLHGFGLRASSALLAPLEQREMGSMLSALGEMLTALGALILAAAAMLCVAVGGASGCLGGVP